MNLNPIVFTIPPTFKRVDKDTFERSTIMTPNHLREDQVGGGKVCHVFRVGPQQLPFAYQDGENYWLDLCFKK